MYFFFSICIIAFSSYYRQNHSSSSSSASNSGSLSFTPSPFILSSFLCAERDKPGAASGKSFSSYRINRLDGWVGGKVGG